MNILLKAKYSFYSALVFFLIANPEIYKIVQKISGGIFGTLASEGGCPTTLGLVFHTFLFFCIILGLMVYPRD
jgi:hypothetical protein